MFSIVGTALQTSVFFIEGRECPTLAGFALDCVVATQLVES
jgi:hypothetical protein